VKGYTRFVEIYVAGQRIYIYRIYINKYIYIYTSQSDNARLSSRWSSVCVNGKRSQNI